MSGSNIETWRLSEDTEVVASNGSTMHARLAGPSPDVVGGRSDFLVDDGAVLPLDVPEVDLGNDVRLARSATGGLSIRSGRLREVLAEAELDARIKLAAK